MENILAPSYRIAILNVEIRSLLIEYQNFMRCFLLSELVIVGKFIYMIHAL